MAAFVPNRTCNGGFGPLTSALFASAMLLAVTTASAQVPGDRASSTLMGSLVDSQSGEVVASVEVLVRAEGDTATVASGLSSRSGRFVIPAVGAGMYEVSFRRLGYLPRVESVSLADTGAASSVDMGSISLVPSAVELTEVNVVVDRPAVVYAADRDIYAADAIVGAAGGGATDVLRGIPDLEVDIDGEVTMYGESPAIYINGREAPMSGESLTLFLEQFPAENIDNVEVMPNPSARYDAEGAGGIVNIVLKEGVGLGISGNTFVNGGTRGQLGTGGRATYQRGPLTLNGGASLRHSSDESSSTELRQNLLVDPITFLGQDAQSDRSSWSGNLDLGGNYELGESTELDADLSFDRNSSAAERLTRYTEMDAGQNITEEYDRISIDDGTGSSFDFALELEHEFGGGEAEGERESWDRGNELNIEFEFERGNDGDDSRVERRVLEELGAIDYATELTWEEDRETESEVALGFDLARELGEEAELEFGYEGEFGWTDESRLREMHLPESPADPISREQNGFLHRQTVHGGYLTLSRDFGELGTQVGLRAEHAGNWLELPDDGGTHGRDYFSLFPSANLNYSFDRGKRLRLSYSKRVRRPSSNVLNPINTSSDPLNRRIGNPAIEPQYTHSFTLNASWSGELLSLRTSPFFRRSVNEWEQLRTVDGDGISTTTYENLGSTNSYGVSITTSVRDFHGFGARVTLNGQRTDRDYAAVLDRITPSSTRWSLRTNLDGEVFQGLTAQGSLTYNPPRDLPQGRSSSTVMTQLGLRYRFLDRRASLNVNITDPLDMYNSSIERSSRG
ncbi:MAG: TonB-dependent receptor, partial [Gemmatimonadota bacterium]